jgi:hypothetical protein
MAGIGIVCLLLLVINLRYLRERAAELAGRGDN